MKNLVLMTLISLSVISNSQIPTDNLHAYYPFNGNANDESTNSFNASVSGAVLGSDRHGQMESCFSFDGVDDYITLPKSFSSVLDNNFTISAWFQYNGENSDDRDYQMIIDFRGEKQFSINIDEPTKKAYIWLNNGGTSYERYSSQTFEIGNWVHVIAKRENDLFVIYLNNIQGNNISESVLGTYSNNNRIGKLNVDITGGTGDKGTFNGKIDDIRIYSRALTLTELTALYEESPTPPAEPAEWQTNGTDIYFTAPGNVGIGTNTPAAKLTVDGPVMATEIKVKADVSTYPDFVFTPDYKLRTLEETEVFILENGHLPGIPSAGQAVQDGISLGEMNAKLLQKIEELTLYIIEKDKEIKEINRINKELQKKIDCIAK